MRSRYGGPKLPSELRDQLGDPANRSKKFGVRNAPLNRKDRRKAERTEKKTQQRQQVRPQRLQNGKQRTQVEPESDEGSEEVVDWDNVEDESTPPPVPKRESPRPTKSILKKVSRSSAETVSEPARIPRLVRDRLAQDDAEIAALEKKLGVKGKKKSKGADDDLENLFDDLGEFESDEEQQDQRSSKRKRSDDDAWLASKRQKAIGLIEELSDGDGEETERSQNESVYSGDFSGLEDNLDDIDEELEDDSEYESGDSSPEFEEEESESGEEAGIDVGETLNSQQKTHMRENPYTAPIVAESAPTTKYIPPALRAPPSSDVEKLSRLKRQLQGLLNRLSEANILSILRDVEKVYQDNPRGYVNMTLVDLLIGMLSDPSTLLDTFIILHAGFIAAVYKVIGADFGAQIIERLVSEFDRHYQHNKAGIGKHTTNLTSVMAELYTFQVIGSNLVFDYIRLFLDELSEINTELLLRIVRAAGAQLRQDDPTSLKDIVILLQKSVAKVGQHELPVRTKFMIETITDLKNNRMKTGVAASTMSREHIIQMKKQLGTLSTRNLKANEPLRISLKDIKDSEKKGKWWLVGASWRDESNSKLTVEDTPSGDRNEHAQENFGDTDEVDLAQLAREHRMNTDVRRAIFVSIMSASDFKDAQIRLSKLNLKKAQEAEIPRVIVHCAGWEKVYNPFYTVLARKICSNHKTRKSFQFALWDIFKNLGEKDDEEDEDDDEDAKDKTSLRTLVNQGKLYGTLIGRKALSITSLKNLNFPYMQSKTSTLVEVLLVTGILETQKAAKDKRNTKSLLEVFIEVDQAPEMVAGLQFFLKKTVGKTHIVEGAEKETVQWACKAVKEMLVKVMATTRLQGD